MKQTEILQTNQLYIFHFIKSKLKLVSEAEPSCLSIVCICFCSARLKVKSSIQLCTKRQNLETPKPLFNSCWLPTPKPPFNLALLAANSCGLQTDSILAGLTWLCLLQILAGFKRPRFNLALMLQILAGFKRIQFLLA